MKIALLTSGIFPFQIGGIQKHSFCLAKYFARLEIFVDIYTITIEEEEKVSEFFTKEELHYINFIELDFPVTHKFPGHYVYASYLFSKELFKLVSAKSYTKIYAQGFTSWYFLKKYPFQKNIISNLHGLEMFQTKINFKNRLEHFILKVPAKKIIKNSFRQISLGGKLTDILYHNGAQKKSVVEIPNAIDASWIRSKSEEIPLECPKKLKFIFIGRYERRKGIEEFQEIIKATIDQFNYEVEFIGPITKDKQLVNKNVVYSGLINDSELIKQKLIKADVLVCPSYSEGMPTVILEAMACGCAIIATDVGAVSLMVDKENGWLIKEDLKKGLEKAIREAVNIKKKELIQLQKQAILKVSAQFTWEKVIKKTIKEIRIEKII